MDYEKKYNEALERAKELHGTVAAGRDFLVEIFPELRESEDERIRKEIRDFLIDMECKKVWIAYMEKQKEQKLEHFELKAGKWYICHRAFCCRADHLTVKEGERFMCEKDGVVKGFVIKEPEKYFKECSAPAPMEDEQKEQKPAEWGDKDEEMRNIIIAIFEVNHPNGFFKANELGTTDMRGVHTEEIISWLKSLRPVSKESLQSHWKPSEENEEPEYSTF